MGLYTDRFNAHAETLSPDDEKYAEKLREIAAHFRGFGEALTVFIAEHGYTGDRENTDEKVRFLRERFKEAGIEPPKNIKAWFTSNKTVSRETAFRLCFALRLTVDEVHDFFKRVQFERSFDCHTIREAVWYFCIRNGLSFAEADGIIDRISVPEKSRRLPGKNILYTGTIAEFIENTSDQEELIRYITENLNDFSYNNATAIASVRRLWDAIAGPDGLAVREGRIIEERHNANIEITREDYYVVSDEHASTWTIYTQIMGLDYFREAQYAAARSLSPVLKKNILLPLRAEKCFPDRQTIEKILRGESGDHESIRKTLIFLEFYVFWAKKVIANDGDPCPEDADDSSRCLYTINRHLSDAGYPVLYSGNPYDWIFMWAMHADHPLEAFRMYIREVFDEKFGEKPDENFDRNSG